MSDLPHDYIIIGSGFGGSVSALRLVDKGYRVLMLEQGSELKARDFPKTNWDLKRWLWLPRIGFRGLFRIEPFRHVTVVAGAGVGGGSLVYANTLPIPEAAFFQDPAWSQLADWQTELSPHYASARRMLGAAPADFDSPADLVLRSVARDRGTPEAFHKPHIAVLMGDSTRSIPDPYFGGEGPDRTPCHRCGACLTGCRHDGKNTLDKNYLYLARKRGLTLYADSEVIKVSPLSGGGYRVDALQGKGRWIRKPVSYTARNVVFAAGALGSNHLLLKLKQDASSLPRLSARLGQRVRTNCESLIFVTVPGGRDDYSQGVALNSMLQVDARSHLELFGYGSGSGFFRLSAVPHAPGAAAWPLRIARMLLAFITQPLRILRALSVWNWAKHTMLLLFMQSSGGALRFERGAFGRLRTRLDEGEAPRARIPEASQLAEAIAHKTGGVVMSSFVDAVFNTPVTAHILGGCTMGASADDGVIDSQHRVFGYEGLYVIDGSTLCANPGVNPALTIAALAERAMSFIPPAGRRDVNVTSPA